MTLLNPMFLTTILAGLIFIVAGIVLIKLPPKKINGFYGYRTVNSMKSQPAWDFAQSFSGRQLVRWGIILLICSLTGLMYYPSRRIGTIIGIGILVAVILVIVISTELAIKKHLIGKK